MSAASSLVAFLLALAVGYGVRAIRPRSGGAIVPLEEHDDHEGAFV